MLQVVELRQQQAERLDMTNFQEKASSAAQRSLGPAVAAPPAAPPRAATPRDLSYRCR